jgi:hypothetical protein
MQEEEAKRRILSSSLTEEEKNKLIRICCVQINLVNAICSYPLESINIFLEGMLAMNSSISNGELRKLIHPYVLCNLFYTQKNSTLQTEIRFDISSNPFVIGLINLDHQQMFSDRHSICQDRVETRKFVNFGDV